MNTILYVRDHIPLEQGLRRDILVTAADNAHSQRPYSIRTRIKTTAPNGGSCPKAGQRPYSIRTRIKTDCMHINPFYYSVRDHIPLEQGLRLRKSIPEMNIKRQRPYSIRTRIKTIPALHTAWKMWVRDHIPLEQGLRPARVKIRRLGVRRQRPYSIRTRIKTLSTRLTV